MLADIDIENAICSGELGVDPYDPGLLQPASLDVRLGEEILLDGNWRVAGDMATKGHYMLPPNQFVLGHTLETVKIPSHLAARVEGKSSWGRAGLMVHITAGFIDPGFEGQITLELKNISAHHLRLDLHTPIAQLSFHRLSRPARHPYGSPGLGSHYQGQRGAQKSRNQRRTKDGV